MLNYLPNQAMMTSDLTNALLVVAVCTLLSACSSTEVKQERYFAFDGRLCPELSSSEKWKTVRDNPRWRDALVASMLGETDVSRYVTGGDLSYSTVYDFNGIPFTILQNANGEILKVTNDTNGCPIGRREFADRKVIFSDREKAPGYKYRLQK